MKSGPTLNGATALPTRRSAPIKPVATVVFPLPDAGAAIITAGVVTPSPPAVSVRKMPLRAACRWRDTHARVEAGSPFDAFLALAAGVHRMLDLCHLGDEVGRIEQLLGRVASGDHHMLSTGSAGER